MCIKLKKVNAFIIKLQCGDVQIFQVRKMFYTASKQFLLTRTRLKDGSNFVESAVFKSILVEPKLKKHLTSHLEKKTIICVPKHVNVPEYNNDAENDNITVPAVREYNDDLFIISDNLNMRFLLPRLNCCVRLSPSQKLLLTCF